MSDYLTRFRNKASVIQEATSKISDFIAASTSKINVVVEGQVNAIPIVFINNDKEGIDEAIIYTYAENGLSVGKYFTWEEWTYLVYKEVKNVKRENYIDSFNAVKCNINFELNGSNIKAHFQGPMRLHRSILDEAAQTLGFDAKIRSVIMVPSVYNIKINNEFYIEDTGWRVESLDKFTTPGISYLNMALKNLVDTEKISTNEPEITPLLMSMDIAAPIEELDPGITYTFNTEDAYFNSSAQLNIKERKKTSIKFSIPFGVKELEIETKELGGIIKKSYKVK